MGNQRTCAARDAGPCREKDRGIARWFASGGICSNRGCSRNKSSTSARHSCPQPGFGNNDEKSGRRAKRYRQSLRGGCLLSVCLFLKMSRETKRLRQRWKSCLAGG